MSASSIRKMAAREIDANHNFGDSEEDLAYREELIDDLVDKWMREQDEGCCEPGELEELEPIPNCDTFGTGEGRWHGRM